MSRRTLPLLAALLLIAGSVAAQPGPGGGTGRPPGPAEDPETRACLEDAETHEDEERCVQEYCRRTQSDWCARECRARPERSFCPRHPPGGPGPGHGGPGHGGPGAGRDARFITFEPRERGFANLTVGGHLVLASVLVDGGELEAVREHRRYEVRGDHARLEVRDQPNGFVRFEARDGGAVAVLRLPEGAVVEPGPGVSRIRYADGTMAILESRHATWDGGTAVVERFFSFHLVPGQGRPAPVGPAHPEDRAKVERALGQGERIGAVVQVNRTGSEVVAYGDVDVRLRPSRNGPTEADPLRVIVGAELPEGRTIVVQVNRTLLDVEPGQLRLRYFDLPDGHELGNRTEVVFRQASSMDDILDPTDDGGQPEYWVVRDANGLQVLVSVPHWSVHMVELSALASILPPSVLIGIAGGAAGAVLAAVVLFAPRRRSA